MPGKSQASCAIIWLINLTHSTHGFTWTHVLLYTLQLYSAPQIAYTHLLVFLSETTMLNYILYHNTF